MLVRSNICPLGKVHWIGAMRMFPSSRYREALFLALMGFLLTPPGAALAHGELPFGSENFWDSWNWEPGTMLGLALTGTVYAVGLRRLWERAGVGRGTSIWQALAFFGGLLAIFAALVSPLHALSHALFSAHMLQHLLLLAVAAPLIALAAPQVSLAWGIPTAWSRTLAGCWHRQSFLQKMWKALRLPLVVWLVYTGTLTIWHLPLFYEAALQNELLHAVEHALLLAAALLFWRTVAQCGNPGGLHYGAGAIFVFSTVIYNGMLGALITFSRINWYPSYSLVTTTWPITALEDQQLAGVIMGIPANLIHLLAVVALLWAWFNQMERQERRQIERAKQVSWREAMTAPGEEEMSLRRRA